MLRREVLSLVPLPFLLAACGASEAAKQVISVYGDSTAYGWLGPNKRMSPTPVENLGNLLNANMLDYTYPGAITSFSKIEKDSSDICILRFGVADAGAKIPYIVYCQHYLRIIQEAKDLGKRVFVVQPTVSLAEFYPPPYDESIYIGDITPGLIDELHPNEEYSRRVDQRIAEVLRAQI